MGKIKSASIKHMDKNNVVLSCVLLLILATTYIVYLTGGTNSSFTHIMYIPIILAAYNWKIKGAAIVAFLGGITLGPLMPKDVAEGIIQEPSSWIFRTVMFVIIGIVIGLLFQHVKTLMKKENEKSFENDITGLPNTYKLQLDLNKVINKKKKFSLVTFKIINLDDINRYTDYSIGIKSLFKVIELLINLMGKDNVYSIYTNQLAVIMPELSTEDAYLKGLEFLKIFKEPISIDGFLVDIIIKGGIVSYPLHGNKPYDLFKKMDIALGTESNLSALSVYNTSIENQNKEKYEIIISLYEALKNDEFHIVYQPKISLNDNRIIGFEALLRWKRGNKELVNPEKFIKIAEDIGIIGEITKWVIKTTIKQLERWQEEGIITKVAINISSKDLKNKSIIEYIKNKLKESKINPTMLELELTERGIIENENMAEFLLNDARKNGMKISLDDFGTGYNSLITLIKLPIDYLKIDKYFIDNIEDEDNYVLINNLIRIAHNLEMKVIAEGVEKEEQIRRLKNMGCDYFQGYYFSKPLPPEEIKNLLLLN